MRWLARHRYSILGTLIGSVIGKSLDLLVNSYGILGFIGAVAAGAIGVFLDEMRERA